jgi:YggT family protein
MGVVIYYIFQIFALLVLARVLMSWVRVDPYHPVAQFIFNTTEPFLKPVRDALPPVSGLDFSPIVLLILLQVIGEIIRQALIGS